jgi:inner membrane protein
MVMDTPASPAANANPAVRRRRAFVGPAVKLSLVSLMLLLMLLPVAYVSTLIKERQARQAEVLSEFRNSWGPQQTLLGPILVVPYHTEGSRSQRYLHIAPSQLTVAAELQPETRKRGIFHATVYGARMTLAGVFPLPAEVPAGELRWAESFLAIRADDFRGLPAAAELRWSDRTSHWTDCNEVVAESCNEDQILVARAGTAPSADAPVKFEASFAIRGTEALWLAPLAKEADVTLSGAWSTPSFGGVSLPDKSGVTARDFSASWHVVNNRVARHGSWVSNRAIELDASDPRVAVERARIGVQLLDPVPTYQMVERASKYAILFLALSFLTYFLFETLAKARIHLVQYGLLGLSISLFALLLISFSEPLGFTAGYAVSALMILLQASLYTATVTGARRQALVFAAVLAALFGFLYVVLILESYSLLVGAVALFAALSVTMAVTRHIDWSPGAAPPAPAAAGAPNPASKGWLELD